VAATMPEVAHSGRAKAAFRVPVSEWLRGPLRGILLDQIREGPLASDGWLDPKAMQQLGREHIDGTKDHGGRLWPIIVSGVWLDSLRRGTRL
jgi:asparagine synthase (glutamine-hydrolysing)